MKNLLQFRNRRRESLQQMTCIVRQLESTVQLLFTIDQEEHDASVQKEQDTEAKQTNDVPVDVAKLTDSTQRLVDELFKAPQRTLDHAIIKSFVMFDDNASAETLRKAVCVARKELKAKNFAYKIVTIRKRGKQLGGYQLVRVYPSPLISDQTLPNVTEPS
jgi:galactokinase/mevalonate kinase-like predicted kinase